MTYDHAVLVFGSRSYRWMSFAMEMAKGYVDAYTSLIPGESNVLVIHPGTKGIAVRCSGAIARRFPAHRVAVKDVGDHSREIAHYLISEHPTQCSALGFWDEQDKGPAILARVCRENSIPLSVFGVGGRRLC